jgi:uncharacterized protein
MDVPADALKETWESVYEKSVKLAGLIEEHCRRTGESFEYMLVVPRGAYYPANIVARELGFDSVHLLHASIGSYKDASSERKADFELGQMPESEQVKGRDILIIEEVCDTGQTLEYLYKYLKENGAGRLRTGVLHYKPKQSLTGFKPDWSVETTEKWIVYPWEVHEEAGLNSVVRKK